MLYGGLAVAAVLALGIPTGTARGVRMLVLVLLFHAGALGLGLTRQPAWRSAWRLSALTSVLMGCPTGSCPPTSAP